MSIKDNIKNGINNLKTTVAKKMANKAVNDAKKGKMTALDAMRKMILSELPAMFKNDHPELKNETFEYLLFVGKKKPDGTNFGVMQEKLKGKDVYKRDMDDKRVKELLTIAPTVDASKVERIIIKFDFLNDKISGEIKNVNSDIVETFNW